MIIMLVTALVMIIITMSKTPFRRGATAISTPYKDYEPRILPARLERESASYHGGSQGSAT